MTKLKETDRAWLIERLMDEPEGAMQADSDSAEDKRFRRLAKSDILTCYDSMFGCNYYDFTPSGRRLVIGKAPQ